MGNKITPGSLRLPLTKIWSSKWFASKNEFAGLLIEDSKLRDAITNHYGTNAGVARVNIKRNPQEVILDIYTSKPGILIGRQGKGIQDLRKITDKLTTKKVHINVIEIKKPDLIAQLVAANIGNQVTKRIPFRRAVRQSTERVMQAGAKGVRIMVSGRLNGAEIARSEVANVGSMPSSSLKSDIDFAIVHAPTTFGIIGIKVWIHKGPLVTEETDEANPARPIF